MQHPENTPSRQFTPATQHPVAVPGMVLDVCVPQRQWPQTNSAISSHAAAPSGLFAPLNHGNSQVDVNHTLQHGLERSPIPTQSHERNKPRDSMLDYAIDNLSPSTSANFSGASQGTPLNNSYAYPHEWTGQSHVPNNVTRNGLVIGDQRPQPVRLLTESSGQPFPAKGDQDNFSFGMYDPLHRVPDTSPNSIQGTNNTDPQSMRYLLDPSYSTPYSSQSVSRPSSATPVPHYGERNRMGLTSQSFHVASTSRTALSSPQIQSPIANVPPKNPVIDHIPSRKDASFGSSTSPLAAAIPHRSVDRTSHKEHVASHIVPTSKPVFSSSSRGSSSSHARHSGDSGENSRRTSIRKAKMHECEICHKQFPRPSGLNTHMNSHSGNKPFKCEVPNCDKSFAVRSNAKRHMRTHGIYTSSDPRIPASGAAQFSVGFQLQQVANVPELATQPQQLRWIQQSVTTRDDGPSPKPPSPDSEVGGSRLGPGGRPFPPSFPSEDSSRQNSTDGELYEERDSYLDGGGQRQVVRPDEHRSGRRPT